jgi:hypothetical protein
MSSFVDLWQWLHHVTFERVAKCGAETANVGLPEPFAEGEVHFIDCSQPDRYHIGYFAENSLRF